MALADGAEFARATFSAINLGAEFITGLSARRTLRNFPKPNNETVVQWQESKQNFSAVASYNVTANVITSGARINGTYYGATGGQVSCDLPSFTLQAPKRSEEHTSELQSR